MTSVQELHHNAIHWNFSFPIYWNFRFPNLATHIYYENVFIGSLPETEAK